ncbi:AsnC family transcriptional regulator [Arthrobacter sp. Helios]|nr:AsnC family transcriptional regulator [Arthrobacter sp. Helios]UPO76585.1 AsnC family transcriptional regulator [Arthrobacter sp. Helios]
MDDTDSNILSILQSEARITYSELGRRVGLSTNAAAARVRRLEASGIILGYRAILGSEAPDAGPGLQAFITCGSSRRRIPAPSWSGPGMTRRSRRQCM